MRWSRAGVVVGIVVLIAVLGLATVAATSDGFGQDQSTGATTPIQHLVVIFQENVSFDHYFATYPHATNPSGEPAFTALPGTPSVNGLSDALLSHNPNFANPLRLDRSQAVTCDQDHRYADEQKAVDAGLMDKFVETVAGGNCTDRSIVMDYYDGNTVTAMWNYAQHFALSDNSYDTTYGPSAVGALNLTAGQTHGALQHGSPSPDIASTVANGTVIGDPGPELDDCAGSYATRISMSGRSVGDLLNAKGVTWGWFQSGFRPTIVASAGKPAVCGAAHKNVAGATTPDYIAHHEPFQFFASTANPHHLPPSSVAKIGQTDRANHQYDLSDFWSAVDNGNMPAVSYLKAAAYQDGHAGYSDPLDEQTFLVNTINRLQHSAYWNSTAVVIAYDDSDGWYDHVLAPVVSSSSDPKNDTLSGAALCGSMSARTYLGYEDRCGYGPRLPLLAISRYAHPNFVDHSLTDQSSILRFVEDNWNLGRIGNGSFDALAGNLDSMFDLSAGHANGILILDPATGESAV